MTTILIVATADLPDPNFRGSTVLVMNNIGPAPAGIIVNRPTKIPVSRVFPDMEQLAQLPDKVYFGGPVEITAVSFLFRADAAPEHATQVVDGVYFSTNPDLLRTLLGRDKPMEGLRIFAGYSGWAPGPARERDRARRLDASACGGEHDLRQQVRAAVARAPGGQGRARSGLAFPRHEQPLDIAHQEVEGVRHAADHEDAHDHDVGAQEVRRIEHHLAEARRWPRPFPRRRAWSTRSRCRCACRSGSPAAPPGMIDVEDHLPLRRAHRVRRVDLLDGHAAHAGARRHRERREAREVDEA
jgi:hypothetical protein